MSGPGSFSTDQIEDFRLKMPLKSRIVFQVFIKREDRNTFCLCSCHSLSSWWRRLLTPGPAVRIFYSCSCSSEQMGWAAVAGSVWAFSAASLRSSWWRRGERRRWRWQSRSVRASCGRWGHWPWRRTWGGTWGPAAGGVYPPGGPECRRRWSDSRDPEDSTLTDRQTDRGSTSGSIFLPLIASSLFYSFYIFGATSKVRITNTVNNKQGWSY